MSSYQFDLILKKLKELKKIEYDKNYCTKEITTQINVNTFDCSSLIDEDIIYYILNKCFLNNTSIIEVSGFKKLFEKNKKVTYIDFSHMFENSSIKLIDKFISSFSDTQRLLVCYLSNMFKNTNLETNIFFHKTFRNSNVRKIYLNNMFENTKITNFEARKTFENTNNLELVDMNSMFKNCKELNLVSFNLLGDSDKINFRLKKCFKNCKPFHLLIDFYREKNDIKCEIYDSNIIFSLLKEIPSYSFIYFDQTHFKKMVLINGYDLLKPNKTITFVLIDNLNVTSFITFFSNEDKQILSDLLKTDDEEKINYIFGIEKINNCYVKKKKNTNVLNINEVLSCKINEKLIVKESKNDYEICFLKN